MKKKKKKDTFCVDGSRLCGVPGALLAVPLPTVLIPGGVPCPGGPPVPLPAETLPAALAASGRDRGPSPPCPGPESGGSPAGPGPSAGGAALPSPPLPSAGGGAHPPPPAAAAGWAQARRWRTRRRVRAGRRAAGRRLLLLLLLPRCRRRLSPRLRGRGGGVHPWPPPGAGAEGRSPLALRQAAGARRRWITS